ncbi:App1 family protein [Brachybacterium aquaticum]|uniref:Phosphatidate phosphatase APP1 n=1 Tax=Brachybacterium aquaticum TaxID=1432564 RepID=A0A841AGY3_9MICO|nr:phosphatase domain-containing protein [Brachybacterium aquaticum]MBB5832344.1 phosphatidate phosphatase APP1 [Brachybacterium aquaticum]
MGIPSPLSSALSALRSPGARTDSDRPHLAARVEDVKNAVVGGVLRGLNWDLRLQPFHGYGSGRGVRVLAKVLYASPRTPADFHDQPVHDMRTMAVRGWRNFAGQVAPNRTVHILLGGEQFTVRADRSGIVDATLQVSLPAGRHQAVLWTKPGNEVTADITVVPPEERIGLVSDIDDTVMVTWLPRPLLAFWNAFVIHQSSRQVVPGMPMLYQRLMREHPQMPVVYLSTGAWNVFPVLKRFLYRNGYPDGPLLLTDWGPTNTGFFRSGPEHKTRSLDRLAAAYPDLRWILVGDDGQHDPSLYAAFAQRHPDNVEAVLIRQLTESEQVLAHGSRRPLESSRSGPDGPPTLSAPDGHGLLAALQREGMLP